MNYIIPNENASVHWTYFDTKNHNVLDLGCGRWFTSDVNELSPVYFAQTASLVVGVDSNGSDIAFYKELTKNNNKFIFYEIILQHTDQIRELILQHKISAIKCDIEGNEKYLLDLNLLDMLNIKELAIEYHSKELMMLFLDKIQNEWKFQIKMRANFANTPDHIGVLFCSKTNV